jgi:hypothetical protein
LGESLLILEIIGRRQERKIMSILSTEEICRVNYDHGGWMKLMRQTYTDNAPFYYVTESHLNYDSSVDSSSHSIQDIIDYMERRVIGNKNIMDSLPQEDIEVRKVCIHHLEVTRQFINQLKAAAEHCGNQQAIAQQPQLETVGA